MAIQLTHRTQKEQQANPHAFGVGLEYGDGGAKALSQALGEVSRQAYGLYQKEVAYNKHKGREFLQTQSNEIDAAAAELQAVLSDPQANEDQRTATKQKLEKLNPEIEGWSLNNYKGEKDDAVNERYLADLKNDAIGNYAKAKSFLNSYEIQTKFSHSLKEQKEGTNSAILELHKDEDYSTAAADAVLGMVATSIEFAGNLNEAFQEDAKASLAKNPVDYFEVAIKHTANRDPSRFEEYRTYLRPKLGVLPKKDRDTLLKLLDKGTPKKNSGLGSDYRKKKEETLDATLSSRDIEDLVIAMEADGSAKGNADDEAWFQGFVAKAKFQKDMGFELPLAQSPADLTKWTVDLAGEVPEKYRKDYLDFVNEKVTAYFKSKEEKDPEGAARVSHPYLRANLDKYTYNPQVFHDTATDGEGIKVLHSLTQQVEAANSALGNVAAYQRGGVLAGQRLIIEAKTVDDYKHLLKGFTSAYSPNQLATWGKINQYHPNENTRLFANLFTLRDMVPESLSNVAEWIDASEAEVSSSEGFRAAQTIQEIEAHLADQEETSLMKSLWQTAVKNGDTAAEDAFMLLMLAEHYNGASIQKQDSNFKENGIPIETKSGSIFFLPHSFHNSKLPSIGGIFWSIVGGSDVVLPSTMSRVFHKAHSDILIGMVPGVHVTKERVLTGGDMSVMVRPPEVREVQEEGVALNIVDNFELFQETGKVKQDAKVLVHELLNSNWDAKEQVRRALEWGLIEPITRRDDTTGEAVLQYKYSSRMFGVSDAREFVADKDGPIKIPLSQVTSAMEKFFNR